MFPLFLQLFRGITKGKVIKIKNNLGIIIETNYNYAYVYFNEEIKK